MITKRERPLFSYELVKAGLFGYSRPKTFNLVLMPVFI